jgi:hypothetical protein
VAVLAGHGPLDCLADGRDRASIVLELSVSCDSLGPSRLLSPQPECSISVFHLIRLMRISPDGVFAPYNLALGKDAPIGRPVARLGRIVAEPMVGGLHHRNARI